MNGAVITLARWHARQVIKRQLYAQGIKLAHVESREITIAANKYIDDHPESMLQGLCERCEAMPAKSSAPSGHSQAG